MVPMWIIQGFGILAMIFYIISYQFKKPALFYLFCFAGSTSFCIHYALLGSIGGCLCNTVSMLKALYLWLFPNVKKRAHFISFIVMFVGVCIFTFAMGWDSYLVILTACASTAHVIMTFQDNPKVLRYIQIGVVSPLWIIYNIFDTFTRTGVFEVSIGGLICEAFVITSSVVYLIRHRKDSKEEPVIVEQN